MRRFVLAHGFGFDNSYWQNLKPMLDGETYYHGSDDIDTSSEYIGIGHSIGFYKLNNSGLKFSHLICLQGFLNFCGNSPKLRDIRERFLSKFIQSFETNTSSTLRQFYKTCGNIPDSKPNVDVLLSDLHLMKESSAHCGAATTVICSTDDEIVPQTIIYDNFEGLDNVTIRCTDESVSHVLGYKNPEIVIETINEIADKK